MGIKVTGGVKVPQGKFTVRPTVIPPAGPALWTWGQDNNGQLGLETLNVNRSSPVQVGALIDWASVSAGGVHSLAIKANGTIWSWGDGANGATGHGDVTDRSSPVQIGGLSDWASINAGNNQTHALKTDGTLWVWGDGAGGALGISEQGFGNSDQSSPIQVGALSDWASFKLGGYHTLAIKTNGELWTWGANGAGRLGIGTQSDKGSPVQVGGLSDWASVSGGNTTSFAIKTNGSLWAWGNAGLGKLGLGNLIYRSSPVQVGGLSDWASVSASNNHTIALKTDGSLWSWGQDSSYGKLGHGDKINKSSPVQVGILTDWANIGTGSGSSFAIKTDGSLWAWGHSLVGVLGNDDPSSAGRRSSPVQIGTLENWASVDVGSLHVLAITEVT